MKKSKDVSIEEINEIYLKLGINKDSCLTFEEVAEEYVEQSNNLVEDFSVKAQNLTNDFYNIYNINNLTLY